jgi:flagellar assembly protein FliH
LLNRIPFQKPLVNVRLVGSRDVQEAAARVQEEREQNAFEKGRREGERALSEQLVRQRAELLELQNGVLDALQQVLPQLREQWEQQLVTLAFEVAQKLVGSLPITAESLSSVIREACQELEDSADYAIQLHPEDLSLIQKANAPLELPGGNMDRVTFQASADVGRGGCVIRTRFGAIDARRETKLELLKRVML